MNGEITLTNMEFYSYIGCFEEEKKIGTRFSVSVHIVYDAIPCAKSDDLAQAINYQKVYCMVKEIMRQPVNLLEKKAAQIIDTLQQEFSQIQHLEVSISKLNPMLATGGKVEAVTVTLKS